MNKVDLTFGIPLYNNEKYILELLNCFQETDAFTYEIIVVDDGSTDNGLDVCKKYNNKHLRVFSKENGGVSNTRNYIIDKARGKWLTFVDSDDLIDFSKYIDIYKKIESHNWDFLINLDKNYKKFMCCKNKLSYLIENEIINAPWMKFYNVELLRKNKIKFNEGYSLGEDLLFNLIYYQCCKKIGYSEGKIYFYRTVNNSSLTQKYRHNKFEELMAINETGKEIFRDNPRVIKSFEYIRIKNCFSCVKSEMYKNLGDTKYLCSYISKLKKYRKFSFVNLGGLKENSAYYLWYFLPKTFVITFIRVYIKIK